MRLVRQSPADPRLAQARALVARALAVDEALVGDATAAFALPGWDSMGQLAICMAIEEATGRRIDDPATVDDLVSVAGIAAYLVNHAASVSNSSGAAA